MTHLTNIQNVIIYVTIVANLLPFALVLIGNKLKTK